MVKVRKIYGPVSLVIMVTVLVVLFGRLFSGHVVRGTTTLIDEIGGFLYYCWVILAGFSAYRMIIDKKSILADFLAVLFFLLTLVLAYVTPDSPTMPKADVFEEVLMYLLIMAGVLVPLIDIFVRSRFTVRMCQAITLGVCVTIFRPDLFPALRYSNRDC